VRTARVKYGVLKELEWPDRSSAAEVKSLLYQSSRFKWAPRPTRGAVQHALKKVMDTYPRSTVPPGFEHKLELGVTADMVRHALSQVKGDSSPGFPLGALFNSKASAREHGEQLIVDAVLARLDLLNSARWHGLSARELVRKGLTDGVRVFIKNEPHPLSKVKTGRLRLIASISVIDEVIERLLCNMQNETEIAQWTTTPSKPGIGFTKQMVGQLIDYVSACKGADGKVMYTDVSGWDWTVQSWMFELDFKARIALSGADPDGCFARVLGGRLSCLRMSLFITSNGEMYEQFLPGIMKSGSYLTSSSNSRMRAMVSYMLGAEWCATMGDDALESPHDGDFSQYGVVLKDSQVGTTHYEFCSHMYREDLRTAIPLNWEKMLFRLLSSPPGIELLMQFLCEMNNSPELERCKAIIQGSGWIPKDNDGKTTERPQGEEEE
jgi:hypothetical protein